MKGDNINKLSGKNTSITVIGAGTWGTTITIMLAEKGFDLKLWVRSEDVFKDINNNRRNRKYTFDHHIPENVRVFLKDKTDELFTRSEIVIFAVPSHVLREIIMRFYKHLDSSENDILAVVNAAKGLELNTNKRLSEVMAEELPAKLKNKISVLSGPNIAVELLQKLPGVSVISSPNSSLLSYLQMIFSNEYFRIYTNTDIAGVEIGAAVKNIIAIAAGVSDGLGYGTNTKASLITRGLYELSKLGSFMGSNLKTISGVAGMGDLITTCISKNSRNRMVGERLAKGESIMKIMKSMHMVAEGINTTKAVHSIALDKKIDLPITEAVYSIIYRGSDPHEAVKKLMARKFKSEV